MEGAKDRALSVGTIAKCTPILAAAQQLLMDNETGGIQQY